MKNLIPNQLFVSYNVYNKFGEHKSTGYATINNFSFDTDIDKEVFNVSDAQPGDKVILVSLVPTSFREDISEDNEELFEYKNEQYFIIDSCKMQIDDEWVDAVIYKHIGTPDLKFVRAREEFYSKFKKVD